MIGRKLSRAAKKLGSACVPLSARLFHSIYRAALGVMIKLLQQQLNNGAAGGSCFVAPRDVNFQLEQ
jgi:hypothetical protein